MFITTDSVNMHQNVALNITFNLYEYVIEGFARTIPIHISTLTRFLTKTTEKRQTGLE